MLVQVFRQVSLPFRRYGVYGKTAGSYPRNKYKYQQKIQQYIAFDMEHYIGFYFNNIQSMYPPQKSHHKRLY